MGYVYKIFFKKDPMTVYVGKTHRPERRLYEHLWQARKGRNSKLYNWIRKHQESDELCFEVLKVTDRPEEDEMEIIKQYREEGYTLKNMTDGGDGIKKGHKHPDTFGMAVRERNKKAGRWKGKDNVFFNKTGSDNHASVKVYQYSLDGKFVHGFDSMSLAAKSVGHRVGRVSRACRTGECAYGFQWRTHWTETIEAKEQRFRIMTDRDTLEAAKLREDGASINKISQLLGFSRSQIKNRIKDNTKF